LKNPSQTVEEGNSIAKSTAESISQMLNDIGRVTARIEKINNATNEQANAIIEISHGLEQVLRWCRTIQPPPAERSRQRRAFSQAEMLREYVKAFKLNKTATAVSGKKSGIYQPDMTKRYVNTTKSIKISC
jgi:methyl-accepting chemotaxis protein